MLRIHMELVITTGVTGMTLSGPMNHKIKILRIIHGVASTVDSNFLSVRHISVTKTGCFWKTSLKILSDFLNPSYTFNGEWPTYVLHCLQCRCHNYYRFFRRSLFSASVVIRLRSRFATHMRDVHAWPVSSVVCCGFPLEVNLTLLQVDFQLFFVALPLSASFPLPWWKLGVQ